MGAPIYSSLNEDAEEIGSVNDLVISVDGEIHAVVIGVGGFLGIGEKNVAVDFASLEYGIAFDETERWVLATTADALTAAPDFVWEDDMAADPAMAPADPAMAPADPAAPAVAPADPAADPAAPADGAMAPADNAMPREGYATVEREALTAENLTGATVIGPEGDDIAVVGDILLTEDGQVDAMLIDFGGFLGIGEKRVAVSLDNLEFAANEAGDLIIYSDFTREQLEAQPEYDEATYADDPAQRATDL
jgi:sporulation protein YlmC with PRC-barrel domain